MQALNKWIALTAAAVLVIVAAGWLVLVSPKRSQAATTLEQVAAQRTANAAQQVELEVLKGKAADLPQKRAALDAVAAKIPAGAQLPQLVRALTTAASTSGVDLVSVTPGAPAAAVAQAPVAPAAPAGAGAPGAAAPAAPPAPAPAAPAAPAPAAPVAPAPGAPAAGALLEIPVTINVVGDYFAVARFLGRIEELPRALRVSDLTLAPGTGPAKPGSAAAPTLPGSPSLTSTITGSVFMTPGPAAAPAASPSAAPTR